MTILGSQVNEQGRVIITAPIRKQMGIEGPAEVIFRCEDGVLTHEEVRDDRQTQ